MRNAVSTGVVLLAMLVPTFAALAMDKPRVADNAAFFSADAIAKANEIIAQAKRDSGKDLYVETQPSIPAEMRSRYSPEQRGKFFADWGDQIGKTNEVDGIVVLVCRDPSYVEVRVGKKTIQQAFIQRDADQLRTVLTSAFKNKQFDQGLVQGAEYVRDTLAQSLPKGGTRTGGTAGVPARTGSGGASNAPATPSGRTTPSPLPTRNPLGGMGSWLCIGAAVLIVFMIFRAMRARAQAPYAQGPGGYGATGGAGYPQQGYGGGGGYGAPGGVGGGAGRGLLGGLLGGMLGGYAYDRFMRRPNDTGGTSSDPNIGAGGGAGGGFDSGGDVSDFGSGGGGGSGGDFGGGGDAGGGGGGDGGGGSGGDF